MKWPGFLLLLCAAGCVSIGEGDEELALELAYSDDGTPAFAGQALTIVSCGSGGYCHSDTLVDDDLANRYGAPAGLGFDLRIASITNEAEPEATLRLMEHQARMLNNPSLIWQQVSSGRMPPSGEAGLAYFGSVLEMGIPYSTVREDGVTFDELPLLSTEEGREIFRNWLASGAPVVERTVERADRQPSIGFVVPPCERNCVDPTWPDIYENIVVSTCARSRCHDDEDPGGDLDLRTGGAMAAHGRLVNQSAGPTGRCLIAPAPMRIVPGMPEESLLYAKVVPEPEDPDPCLVPDLVSGEPIPQAPECGTGQVCRGREGTMGVCDICGAHMPLAGNQLTEQRLCALREWILGGACADPADCPGFDLDAARIECGVVIEAGVPACVSQVPCPARVEL